MQDHESHQYLKQQICEIITEKTDSKQPTKDIKSEIVNLARGVFLDFSDKKTWLFWGLVLIVANLEHTPEMINLLASFSSYK